MPNPNAVVARIIRFDPPLDRPAAELLRADRGISILLEGDQRVSLDPGDPRSVGFVQLLDGLSKQRLPVYIETKPDTAVIARLLIPHVARVMAIEPRSADALGVELEFSHARHVLRRGQADY